MTSYINKMKKNITLSYIYNSLMFFRFTGAIWVVYLASKGMSLIEIGILESIFHGTCFMAEIPTGALADIYGRKFSMILGRVCSIIDAVLMIFSHSFAGFAIAMMFSGLSYTLNSGAGESLTYDSLKQLGREGEYKKIYGTIYAITEVCQGIAVILGGILADKRFLYAYLATIAVGTMALILSFSFTEPEIREKGTERIGIFSQVKESIDILKMRRLALYLIVFFALISALGTTIYLYCQQYFSSMSFSKTTIAVIFTGENIINALSSKLAYRIEKKLKQKGIIMLMPVINLAAMTGLVFTREYAAVIFFLMISFVQGIGYPIFSDYINSLIPSENRATILSIESAAFSIVMIIFFPMVGYLGDKLSIPGAFGIAAILFVPMIIFVFSKLRKHNIKADLA